MATLFDKSRLFSRSQSSTNVTKQSTKSQKNKPQVPTEIALPRSSSYTSVNEARTFSFSSKPSSRTVSRDVSRDVSRESSPRPTSRGGDGTQSPSSTGEGQGTGKPARPKLDTVGRRKSLAAASKTFMSRVRGSPDKSDAEATRTSQDIPALSQVKEAPPDRSRTTTLRSNSWMNVSRSPSPSRTVTTDDNGRDDTSTLASSVSCLSLRDLSPTRSERPTEPIRSKSAGTSLFRRSTQITRTKDEPPLPTTVPISSDLHKVDSSGSSGFRNSRSSLLLQSETSASPKLFSKDKLASLGLDSHKKKDELWSVFRALETDYQKFSAKSSALRVNVVRTTLLPFLRSHTDHAANKVVRVEDLDKRINVLDKWWVGLLEMLDGSNNRYVSGGDRPAILEALSGIISRPEWRLAPSEFAPYCDQASVGSLPRVPSLASLDSAASLYRTEAVYEKVRSTFVHNLLMQMDVVVEKMSLKTAPASLVSFCGKATAYAFFFCPGIADVLVKVWGVQPDVLRRMADEYGLARAARKTASDEMIENFPLSLQSLGWTSPKTLMARLRQPTPLPAEAAKVKWHGGWTSRWFGRDSDLFFVFCKHYHILLEEFLPPGTSFADKARAPCFVLVQCQLLTSLEATIHRQASGDMASALPPVTFDELLRGADASADALPLAPSTNVQRMMAENRLITLLRDFLVERSTDYDEARRTFATAFVKVMHATAKRTSQFDHSACFTLCDFMDEALTIYVKFEAVHSGSETIDWKFWLDVCRKMLQSQNTMTELRVLSLVFGAWNTICADDQRKERLCLNWLVTRETFQTYFLHWCPMVRAYYMRLLCWRMCRFTGEASKLDTKIMAALYVELKLVWANYLALRNSALQANAMPPSTAACLPAPNRHLLIIRVDTQAAAATLMLGLDVASQKSISSHAVPTRGSLGGSPSMKVHDSPEMKASPKSRWSIRSKSDNALSSATGPGHAPSKSSSPGNDPYKQGANALDKVRTEVSASRSRPPLAVLHKRSESSSSTDSGALTPTSSYRAFSFKFSLEWSAGPSAIHQAFYADVSSSTSKKSRNVFNSEDQPYGKERKLSPPRLPAPAHSWLVSSIPGSSEEIHPMAPAKGREALAKYCGRALAEWFVIVTECNNFVARRMAEGVPSMKVIEVPVLGVEGFRKFL